ncbi:MAG: S1C family serine protease [Planctomycetota bacterium]
MLQSTLVITFTTILASCASAQGATVRNEPMNTTGFPIKAKPVGLRFKVQDPTAPPANEMPSLQGLGYIGQGAGAGGSLARSSQSPRNSIIAHKIEFQMGDEKVECTAGPGDAIVISINGSPAGKDRYLRTEEGFEIMGKDGKPAARIESLVRNAEGKLVTKKTKLRAFLGVTFNEAPAALADQLNLAAKDVSLVSSVNDDSAAKLAGLQEHDVIIAVDGNKPAGPDQLRQAIAKKKPNDEIVLTVIRKQKEITITARLGSAPSAALTFDLLRRDAFANEAFAPLAIEQFSMESDASKAAMERSRADMLDKQNMELQELSRAKQRLDETRAETAEAGEFVIMPNSNNSNWVRARAAEGKADATLEKLEARLLRIEKMLAELAEARAVVAEKK